MSKHAWKMHEDMKVRIGKMIVERIENDEPFPQTPEEGKQLLESLGVEFLGELKGVQFHQNEIDGIMHVAVPPREAIKAALERIRNEHQYSIPQTYADITNDTSNLTEAEERFHFRIGDYTISHCG